MNDLFLGIMTAIGSVEYQFPLIANDQLQAVAWKYLIPLSLVNIVATGVLKVVF